jgi:hypothetical protein
MRSSRFRLQASEGFWLLSSLFSLLVASLMGCRFALGSLVLVLPAPALPLLRHASALCPARPPPRPPPACRMPDTSASSIAPRNESLGRLRALFSLDNGWPARRPPPAARRPPRTAPPFPFRRLCLCSFCFLFARRRVQARRYGARARLLLAACPLALTSAAASAARRRGRRPWSPATPAQPVGTLCGSSLRCTPPSAGCACPATPAPPRARPLAPVMCRANE